MPYKKIKEGKQWCVYTVDGNNARIGKTHGCHPTPVQADVQIAGLYAEEDLLGEDEGYGKTLTAVALTNEPFIALKDHPVSLAEIGDESFVRVPFLVQGIYSHWWYGALDFNQKAVNRILRNHVMGVTEQPVQLRVGHRDNPALAFFDPDRGGWLEEEEVDGDKLLVAYGPPVNTDLIETHLQEYVCASMDLDTNYMKAQIVKYSKGNGDRSRKFFAFNNEWRIPKKEAPSMPEKKTFSVLGHQFTAQVAPGGAGLVVAQSDLDALVAVQAIGDDADEESEIEQLRQTVASLEAQIKSGNGQAPEVPEGYRTEHDKMKAEIETLKQEKRQSDVSYALSAAKSYRDESGNTHSALYLNWLDSFLSLGPIGDEGKQITLAEDAGVTAVKNYMLKAALWLSQNQPGTMPAAPQSTPGDKRLPDEDDEGDDEGPINMKDTVDASIERSRSPNVRAAHARAQGGK